MKKNYKNKLLGMSLTAAMLLSSSAFAGKIIGVTAGTVWDHPSQQYGFHGWNLTDVVVNITSDSNFSDVIYPDIWPDYDLITTTAEYPEMNESMSFESIIYTEGQIRGRLHGKDWPVGEPSGIKVVNDDFDTNKSGKSPNCIMTTSYLSADDTENGESGYLDAANPVPTVCSSPFQTHKRFKINMQESTVAVIDGERYGKPIDLVFNLDINDDSSESRRYQVFSKINNYTGMRLDGYKVELLDENGTEVNASNQIKFSLDLVTDKVKQSEDESGYEAVFSNGLWGPLDTQHVPPHFETNGFFDSERAGFEQAQQDDSNQTLVGGPTTLVSNYEALFGLWLPSKWAPYGIFFDDDNDPTTDAELVAFWGTVPNAVPGTPPAWHYGKNYMNPENSWAEPTVEEILTWVTDPLYSMGLIEDTLNLGLNYVVEIGQNSTIGKTFTIRIRPHVAPEANQTAPNYIDSEGKYIMPPTDYNGTDVHLVISPAPYFNIGANIAVGLADPDLNTKSDTNETYDITLTTTSGDTEILTLTETDVNSSIFVGTIGTNTDTVATNSTLNVANGTVVTATYGALTATTTATDGTPVLNPSSGGGGGCSYNHDSKNFDIGFMLMMALGLLYPFRRRFIK